MTDQCPFKGGDVVVFVNRSGKAGRPGYGGLPKIGSRVIVAEIVDGPFGKYVRWEGGESYAGGGLHWSEFEAATGVS